jgi:hypothetical protein
MTLEENRMADLHARSTVSVTVIEPPSLSRARRRVVATLHHVGQSGSAGLPLTTTALAIAFMVSPTSSGSRFVNEIAASGTPVQILSVVGQVFAVLFLAAALLGGVMRAQAGGAFFGPAAIAAPALLIMLLWVGLNSYGAFAGLAAVAVLAVAAEPISRRLNGGFVHGATEPYVQLHRELPDPEASTTPQEPAQRDETLTDRISQVGDGHLRTPPAEGTSHVRR